MLLHQATHRGAIDVIFCLELLPSCQIDIAIIIKKFSFFKIFFWEEACHLPHDVCLHFAMIVPFFYVDCAWLLLRFLQKHFWVGNCSPHHVHQQVHHAKVQLKLSEPL